MIKIEEITPAESPRNFNFYEDENYLMIVLMEEDTSKFLKVNRIHIFKNIDSIKKWLNDNRWDYYVIPDNSMIVFRVNYSYMEYFAYIFWGYNHLNEENIFDNKKIQSNSRRKIC